MGDIGERAILDSSILTIAFAGQIGRRRVAIGNLCHVHAYITQSLIVEKRHDKIFTYLQYAPRHKTEVLAQQAFPLPHRLELQSSGRRPEPSQSHRCELYRCHDDGRKPVFYSWREFFDVSRYSMEKNGTGGLKHGVTYLL